MRRRIALLTLFLAASFTLFGGIVFPGKVTADSPPQESSAPLDEQLPKLLERSTMLLVDLDLNKVEVASAFAWVMQRLGGAEENPAAHAPPPVVEGVIRSLRSAGVQHLYIIVPTQVIHDGGPLVVIPCEDAQAVEGLAAALLSSSKADAVLKVRRQAGRVLIGPHPRFDRLDAATGNADDRWRQRVAPC